MDRDAARFKRYESPVRKASLLLSLAVGATALGVGAGHAAANDFWDEVRTPHVRAYRVRLEHGREALREGRADTALADADATIALAPERAPGHVLRVRALVLAGGAGDLRAVESVRAALAADPAALDDPVDAEPGARAAALAGDHALASRVLARAVSRMDASQRSRGRLYVLLGDMLLAAGPDRLREAVLAFREGVAQAGDERVRARLGLALALRRAGELEEARSVAREVLVHGGLVESALGADRALLPLTEVSARAAIALEALGDLEGAREKWTRAAEGGPWRAHAAEELARLAPPAVAARPLPAARAARSPRQRRAP
jgi:tetratricopeptide (TPR) repeat protein